MTILFVMHVCLPACLPVYLCASVRFNLAPTRMIFMKFDISKFFENMSKIFKFHLNVTRTAGTLHEDRYTYMIATRFVLLRMNTVSDKSCAVNQNTHFMINKDFFFSKIMSFVR